MKRRETQSKTEILEALKASGRALSHDMIQDSLDVAIDRATIYRVQEGCVVQWGRKDDGRKYAAGVTAKPPAEYELPLPASAIVPLGFADAYSALPGFVDGWPVGYDAASGTAALAHCYAAVGAGRDLAPDTGAGGEVYAIIGHAPRRLDRNIANVGRVIDGFDAMTALPRGTCRAACNNTAPRPQPRSSTCSSPRHAIASSNPCQTWNLPRSVVCR